MASLCWPPELRPKLLPLEDSGLSKHLYSKIGLFQAFSAGGVRTPPSCAASSPCEAVTWAREHGYPVLLKADSSGGGVGIRECNSDEDIRNQKALFLSGPVLVQKKINGIEIDVSAIYLNHQIVHFSYARIEKSVRRFAPSSLRTYYPLPLVPPEVFDELKRLGRVLAADGFSNIHCIEAADGSGRYYFEADLRPNVWVDFPKFFGEDPAPRIRAWFLSGACLSDRSMEKREECVPVTIPYFLRLKPWEVMINRYSVWKYISLADRRVVLRIVARLWCAKLPPALHPGRWRKKLRSLLASRLA